MTVAELIQKLQALPASYQDLTMYSWDGEEVGGVVIEGPPDSRPEDNIRVVLS